MKKSTTKMMAAMATVALTAAACGSDDPVAEEAPVETDAMEEDAMEEEAPVETDAMEEDAMEDDAMEDDAMEEEAPVETDAMEEDAMEDDAMEEGALEPTGELCAAVPADGEGSFAGMTDDPAATAASNNPALSTLVAAVTEAGLVDTLNGDGPFTIFAPANPAFEALGEEAVAAVLADQELLTSILTLHVVAGEKLSSADLAGTDSLETVNGQEITFEMDGDSLIVNGQATVGCADVQTANATVHIIDAVLMPEAAEGDAAGEEAAGPTGDLCAAVPADGEGSFAGMTDDPAATAASNNPALSTLVAAVTEADLVDTLNGDGPFTIFAPANVAFESLPEGTVETVLADKELLTSILTLHVVAGEQLSSADLAELDSVATVNGQDITLEMTDAGLSVNGGQATVGCADVQTANATVHIIDGVLLPG